jgi:Flavoprotein
VAGAESWPWHLASACFPADAAALADHRAALAVPDAIVVAPATYNTINKWAQGISDTYALGLLAEITGLGIPIVVLPFVNSALANRAPFRRSVESLRSEGVRILIAIRGGAVRELATGERRIYPPRIGRSCGRIPLWRPPQSGDLAPATTPVRWPT